MLPPQSLIICVCCSESWVVPRLGLSPGRGNPFLLFLLLTPTLVGTPRCISWGAGLTSAVPSW